MCKWSCWKWKGSNLLEWILCLEVEPLWFLFSHCISSHFFLCSQKFHRIESEQQEGLYFGSMMLRHVQHLDSNSLDCCSLHHLDQLEGSLDDREFSQLLLNQHYLWGSRISECFYHLPGTSLQFWVQLLFEKLHHQLRQRLRRLAIYIRQLLC